MVESDVSDVFLDTENGWAVNVNFREHGGGLVSVAAIVSWAPAVVSDGEQAKHEGQLMLATADRALICKQGRAPLIVVIDNVPYNCVSWGPDLDGHFLVDIRGQDREYSNAVTLDGIQKRFKTHGPHP